MKTVTDLQIWVLVSVLGVIGSIAIGVVSWGLQRMIKSVDAIREDLHRLSMNMATHDQRIQTLHEADNNLTTRMNDHSKRMQAMELAVAIIKSRDNDKHKG
jgi:hypothetical protein